MEPTLPVLLALAAAVAAGIAGIRWWAATPTGAAQLGDDKRLRALLSQDPELVRRRFGDDWTLLHYARTKEVAALLVERGADVASRTSSGLTPLHMAAGGNREGVVELLLSKGAPVNAQDREGATPLDFWTANRTQLQLATLDKTRGVVGLLLAAGGGSGVPD